jgi:tetratricopeptide (TPR) repeat protein
MNTPGDPVGAGEAPTDGFVVPPDAGGARTLDDLIERLRVLKTYAGNPSYEVITARVNAAWTAGGRPPAELARRGTVVDCFRTGRRRLNTDLFLAVVQALHPDAGYVAQWRQALTVALGESRAAAQVRTQDTLPADLAEFTGRADELARIRQTLRRSQDDGGAVVISAIEGMPGVGKTRLAVRAGHLLAREQLFDQVLFVNLRGFHPDPAQPPADPAAVLDGFLRLLGVPGQQVPHDLAARAALYRRRLAGRRAFVLLDNAFDEHQVRPLLPDSPGCLTLVTSRRALTGLAAVTHLTVDVFTADDAVDLLARAVPGVPIGGDPDALARVAHRCGYLPLALGLVTGQMRTRPGWTVTDHADRLDDRHRNQRIDSGVELALSLSYQQLPADRRRLFRLLSLHPGHDFDRYAAASLIGGDPDTATGYLHDLYLDHLLQPAAPGRFAFHDLVRAYATERTNDEDRPSERRGALTRLLDQYLYTAAAAMDVVIPVEQHRRPHIPPPATPTPPMADLATARAWLDTEITNLTAAAVHAAAHDRHTHTKHLAAILYRYLDTAGYFGDAIVLHTHARRAAQHTGDRDAEGHALANLGNVHGRLGDYRRAADYSEQALTVFREIGDRYGESRALTNLGNVYGRLGDYRQGAHYHRLSITVHREIGDRLGEARSLGHLGSDHERLGDYQQATDHHRRALALYREVDDRFGEARTLTNLGLVHERVGDYQQAVDHHERALALFREIGYRYAEAHALTNLGSVHLRTGRIRQAVDHHRQALAVFREIGDRGGEAEVLNSLGETLRAEGLPDQARIQHAAALALAEHIEDSYEQARAHDGLAHTHHAAGEAGPARDHWQQALARYTDLGVPEADKIRAQLVDSAGSGRPAGPLIVS